MKILGPDQITAVAASSENANYPKENVQDIYRLNPWMSNVSAISTLTLTVSANNNAVFLAYTNSGTVTVEVKDAVPATIYGPTVHTIDSRFPNLWVDYTLQSGIATIILTFSDPGAAAPYCGICRAGYAYDFRNPKYGLQEGLKDLSVSKTLANFAEYYEFLGTLRTFDGNLDIERDSDFYTFLYTLIAARGRGPYAWLVTDLSGTIWSIWAWLDATLPKATHDYYAWSEASFAITEAL